MGEPGTRCKNPSVATYLLWFGHVPKDPVANRADCPGFLDPYLLKDTGPRPAVASSLCPCVTRGKQLSNSDSEAMAGFHRSPLLAQSVLSCTATKITDGAGSPGDALRSEVSLCCCTVGYVWYHKVFIIQTKSDRLTILCTVKQKGSHSSIKTGKQRLNNISLTIQSHCLP